MPLWYLLILAVVQGITEFLPVSSSAHLILVPELTGLPDQGTFLDVAVHIGTLGAVILYFRQDVARAAYGTLSLLRGGRGADERLALNLAIATIPIVLAGLAVKLLLGAEALRSLAVIGWATLIFGVALWLFDRYGPATRTEADWSPRHAFVFGLWQAAALIPGASRSGTTITGARMLGYDRSEAARLAMLMSIPTILASGTILVGDVVAEANWPLMRDAAIGAAFSFVAALAALHVMMRLLRSVSFTPYVIYRLALGAVLLWWAYA